MAMLDQIGGRIITFYSFKGGVGRTMSLANIAFLAANVGKRVLIMDWDLEAPGLAYYFRGLLGPEETDRLRKAPGVLNILWDWHRAMADVTGRPDVDALLDTYAQGSPFEACTQTMLGHETFDGPGEVHYVSAGSLSLQLPGETPYSEALSLFPWPQFFSDSVGGALIDEWRKWAKRNFDLILVDSRTGLADVAGVCTMLFPDEVFLCFVLNRQNIEGTARVAASIRERRKGEVRLRAAPMRVAREGTSEEADARANAIRYLTRIGKFNEVDVTRDFGQLAVLASPNIPFYETLSPFAAAESLAPDPLTFNYCAIATAILGEPVHLPKIKDTFRQQVRRRLAPRSATIDYVSNLLSAEPTRAIQELLNLVDSAQLAMHEDGEIPGHAYINVIVETALGLNAEDLEVEYGALLEALLQLIRKLCRGDSQAWRQPLVYFIERLLSHVRYDITDPQTEVSLLDELDHLLAEEADPATLLTRVGYRRRAAQILAFLSENDRLVQLIDETFDLLHEFEEAKPDISPDEQEAVVVDRIDLHLLSGDALVSLKQPDVAYEHFLAGIALANEGDRCRRTDIRRLLGALHSRIAARFDEELISPTLAAHHALQAIDANAALVANNLRMVQMAVAFAHPAVPADLARAFLERVYSGSAERGQGIRGGFVPGLNTLRATGALLRILTALIVKASESGLSTSVMTEISQTAARMIAHGRGRTMTAARPTDDVEAMGRGLRDALASRGIDTAELDGQLDELAARRMARGAMDNDAT